MYIAVQTVLIKMITISLRKYRLFYRLTSKQITPLFRCFPPANEHLIKPPLYDHQSRYSSAHNCKMIAMRRGMRSRGMLEKSSRQNQTEYRHNFFCTNSSDVTSSTATLEPMTVDEETVAVPPVTKRAKIDTEMSTTVLMNEEPMPVKKPTLRLRFKKISSEAKAPTKGSEFAAGFDLYSAYEYTVPAGGKEKVLTDISIELPESCYGRVAPRSGLAWKNQIDVGAGVIDRDYRGNIGVILFNLGKVDFKVEKDMRIAQLICERICYPELEEVEELGETQRGSDGYGSTGTK
ncbi:uncharacterized protein [Asterias amurensis]|uniref:uncharacterized protein n=1 Tax=Asterias amurensis TaxID=7602 RepID=UPI003AB3B856